MEGETLDGGGNHAWMVAPSAIDFAIASHRTGGGVLTVRNVRDIAELKLLEGFAGRYGASAQVTAQGRRHGDRASDQRRGRA